MPEPITMVMVGAGGGGVLLELARRQFRIFKEVLDIVGGSLLFMGFMPLMLLCALLIKLWDPAGPVLYRQVRVGLNGRLFTIYKLRSMYVDAEAHGKAVRAGQDDPRVIPVCRWMRKSHVDELPQLFNIVRGEMSLVGPRPERPEMFEELSREMPDFEKRLAVKPGLTGMAQIYNGYDTDIESVKRKLKMDLEYIDRMSLALEFKLLFSTFAKFNDSGAR
ncbi:MAG: exopolysaccharide biosynthesis protein [Phycisphaera sp.]|nr:exopolysaccharide biosynthesis protein [Phycisphaera sp.]